MRAEQCRQKLVLAFVLLIDNAVVTHCSDFGRCYTTIMGISLGSKDYAPQLNPANASLGTTNPTRFGFQSDFEAKQRRLY